MLRQPHGSTINWFTRYRLLLACLSLPLWAQTGMPTGRECSSEAAQKLEKDVATSSKEAQQEETAGAIVVVGVVDETGRACGAWRVVRSRGRKKDEDAFATVSQKQFRPATKDGKPTPVRASIEIQVKTE